MVKLVIWDLKHEDYYYIEQPIDLEVGVVSQADSPPKKAVICLERIDKRSERWGNLELDLPDLTSLILKLVEVEKMLIKYS